jgi:hypothetical protein
MTLVLYQQHALIWRACSSRTSSPSKCPLPWIASKLKPSLSAPSWVSVAQFNLATGNWSTLSSADTLLSPPPRYGLALCTLNDSVLLFGGSGSGIAVSTHHQHQHHQQQQQKQQLLAPLWRQRLRWQEASRFRQMRKTSAKVSPHVLLAGAISTVSGTADESQYNDLYQLNAMTLQWTAADRGQESGPAPSGRNYHGFATLGGRAFVFGGNSAQGAAVNGPSFTVVHRRRSRTSATACKVLRLSSGATPHNVRL